MGMLQISTQDKDRWANSLKAINLYYNCYYEIYGSGLKLVWYNILIVMALISNIIFTITPLTSTEQLLDSKYGTV